MQLLTKELRRSLPPLRAAESPHVIAMAQAKFFTPDSSWTWYASEFDGEDIFYGLVDGHDLEFGYFSLRELHGVRGHLGLPIERDRFFTPVPLLGLYDELHRERFRDY